MVRKKIKVDDFNNISLEHEFYLWHFVRGNQDFSQPTIRSIFDFEDEENQSLNRLIPILDVFDVDYFESYIEDSIDFLDNLGVPIEKLRIKGSNTFNSIILSFNRKRLVNASYNGFCLCPEGVVDLLFDLNPDIVLNANLD